VGYIWGTNAKNMGFDVDMINDCNVYCDMHTTQTLLDSIENDNDGHI
jgi:hypothetical protein